MRDYGKDLYPWMTVFTSLMQANTFLSSIKPTNLYTLWHNRLGHVSDAVLTAMCSNPVGMVNRQGVNFTSKDRNAHNASGICHGCALGRMRMIGRKKREPLPRSSKHLSKSSPLSACDTDIDTPIDNSSSPGSLVFMDILHSPTVSYPAHYTMALILVDSSTRYVWVYPMRTRDEAPAKVTEWAKWMHTRSFTPQRYHTIRSDNDSVFIGKEMLEVMSTFRIVRELSAPNGHVPTVERLIETLRDRVRCMLYHNNGP